MNRMSKLFMIAAASMAMTGTALAEDAPATVEGEAAVGVEVSGEATVDAGAGTTPAVTGEMDVEAGVAGLTLGAGKIVIAGSTFNMSLSKDAVAKPFSLAPSVWYGVSDKLTVGLTHDRGTTMLTPRPIPGAGICLAGKENGCGKVYNNIGVDALFALAAGKFSVAAHPGLDILSFSDPSVIALRVGVLGKYEIAPKIAIAFDPRISIGLTERDLNKESIDIPFFLWFAASEKIGAYVSTGIAGPLDGFGDAFVVPVGLGANFKASEKLSIGGDFLFGNLLGNGSSADSRALGLRVAFAL